MDRIVTCTFAEAGTYGHECNKKAVTIAVFKSRLTESGLFYAGRCKVCSEKNYGENIGIIRFEEIKDQVNDYKSCYDLCKIEDDE